MLAVRNFCYPRLILKAKNSSKRIKKMSSGLRKGGLQIAGRFYALLCPINVAVCSQPNMFVRIGWRLVLGSPGFELGFGD